MLVTANDCSKTCYGYKWLFANGCGILLVRIATVKMIWDLRKLLLNGIFNLILNAIYRFFLLRFNDRFHEFWYAIDELLSVFIWPCIPNMLEHIFPHVHCSLVVGIFFHASLNPAVLPLSIREVFEQKILPWCKENGLELLIIDNDPNLHSKCVVTFMAENVVQIYPRWGKNPL